MKLASIISKYIDTESIGDMTGTDFAYELFSKMEADEINQVDSILLGETELEPNELILGCMEAMIKNNLLDLLTAYKQLGFK